MNPNALELLRCPACKGELDLKPDEQDDTTVVSGHLVCQGCNNAFEIAYGLPNLVHPELEKLPEIDREFLDRYQRIAGSYDRMIRFLMLVFGIWEPRARRRALVAPLQLKAGDRVLEVSAGTGSNLTLIADEIGNDGQLFALDLSPGMLAVARKKLAQRGISAEFELANAAYLPYRSGVFDAVLHFGGLNTFGDKVRGLAEMARVARPGARIVIGDEGLAPGKEKTRFGRWLLKHNTLYANTPPMDLLPDGITEIDLRWIWRGLYYVISFRRNEALVTGSA
jgi:ubiquinone/menaquinone biosynthesis C-methylase UbiE/uncharacterized protein YbaR (Trm112 family)